MGRCLKGFVAVQAVGAVLLIYSQLDLEPPAAPALPSSPEPAAAAAVREENPSKAAAAAAAAERNRARAEALGAAEHYPEESIFIALASYGDQECSPTVARAFARAVHPDRIFFGIYQQHNCTGEEGNAAHCLDCVAQLHEQVKCPSHPICSRLWQVRTTRLHMRDTLGVTYGRYMAEKHLRNETYIMNIDSHSHFERGWDSVAINMFKSLKDDYAVITTYPVMYGTSSLGHESEYEMSASTSELCICQSKRLKVPGGYSFKHVTGHMKRPAKPVRSAFLAAGFNFARSHRNKNVPYDPYTPFLFDGEEMSFGVRLWTHGYDLYHPNHPIVAHLYIQAGSKLRPVFWGENWGQRAKVMQKSVHRMNYLLGLHDEFNVDVRPEDIDLREKEKYGVGSVRPVAEFWKWARVEPSVAGPEVSGSLCSVYQAGGMPKVHRPGIDPEPSADRSS